MTSVRVVSFKSPWVKDRLKNISEWWGIPFDFDYYDTDAPIEMRDWGESLAVFDDAVPERWKDPQKDLTILVAPYQAPKNFLGFYLSLRASVRGLCDIQKRVIQVFANESESSYVNNVNQGHAFEVYANHELAHYFYLMNNRLDRTHELFYSGVPELARTEILSFLPKEPPKPVQLVNAITDSLGKSFTKDAPAEKGCAETVCKITQKVYPNFPTILHTADLNNYLSKDQRFKATTVSGPGKIIISPTKIESGHVGFFLPNGRIASNNSETGIFEDNYSLQNWVESFRTKKGLSIYYYEIV